MNCDIVKSKLINEYHIDIIKVYQYGSRVYGTNTPESDYDFIAISNTQLDTMNYSWDNVDVTVYSVDEFQNRVDKHEISALECIWSDADDELFTFTLDLVRLRDSISTKTSHCWVKGKKKITVGSIPPKPMDKYIGLKSIFHAFRICDYGIQIAEFDKIVDYSRANHMWTALCGYSDSSWDSIYNKFKSEFNSKMTEFRIHCPKII